MNSKVYAYAPDLDLPEELAKHIDHVRYYISTVYVGLCEKKHTGEKSTRISSRVMQTVLTPKLETKIRAWLLANNIVRTDHSYEKGVRCKAYEIRPSLLQRMHRWEITNERLRNRILANRLRRPDLDKNRKENAQQASPLQRHLEDCLYAFSVDESAWQEKGVCLEPLDRLAAKDFLCSWDLYGRFHSPVSRLTGSLRKYLRIGKDGLVNLDVANSQLLFVLKLYYSYLYNKELPGGASSTICQSFDCKGTDPIANAIEGGTLYQDLTDAVHEDQGCADYLLSYMDAERRDKEWNRLYKEYIGGDYPRNALEAKQRKKEFKSILPKSKVQYAPALKDEIDRNVIKQTIFRDVLYSRLYCRTQFTELFDKHYPRFFAWLFAAKKALREKDKTNHLAHEMQRAESDWMYAAVCSRLMTKRPEIVFATIHDSILVSERDAYAVKHVMLDEFARIGLKARIRKESL